MIYAQSIGYQAKILATLLDISSWIVIFINQS